MAAYALSNTNAGTQQNLSSSYKTLLSLTAATGATTLRRGWIYDVTVGADGTPGDNEITYKIDRQTTVGTATAATPAPLDPADAAALLTANVNNTAEPTVTSATQLFEMPLNQRASYHWMCRDGSELVVPATNAAGLGLRAKSAAYTSTALGVVLFRE